MKHNKYTIPFLLSIMLITASCSRKKNTFVSRNFHALTTKYNVMYNGDIALQKGLTGINNQYTENFWELLPVERMQVSDELNLANEAKNPDFQVAEEKAAKAIRKHAMNIKGKEKNPQMDEAYLLLGKARYYDQRFVPALAAFNYILNKYPTSDKINLVKIWREKANIRLDNNEVAIKKLKRLLKEENLEGQYMADASATLAQAYLNQNIQDTAMVYLDSALVHTKIKEEKGRYHFIKGQLFNQLNQKDSANVQFNAIIKMHRQLPRAYYINAHLQKSFNFVPSETYTIEDFEAYLTDLETNRENRPFLDKIYYRIAEFHRENDKDSLAEVYYNKSIGKSKNDNELKRRNYITLGNMRFDNNLYKAASEYYDSTLAVMDSKTRAYRDLEKKRRSLDDIIKYEAIANTNDSILHIVSLPKAEQLALFTKKTNQLKAEAIAKAEAEQDKRDNALQASNLPTNTNTGFRPIGDVTKPTAGNFYFYNTSTVAFGKSEFLRIWGNRKLQDNWRFVNQRGAISGTETPKTDNAISAIENNPIYKSETYLKQLPTDSVVIDSLAKQRNFAYYQLGSIYREKLKENQLAITKFEALLKLNPQQRLVLPTHYNLYKLYTQTNILAKAETEKQFIIHNYPESRYAEILKNPDILLKTDKNDPEVIYKDLYEKYNAQKYAEVIDEAENKIIIYEGDAIVPKFEMLKAVAKGRLFGFGAYKDALNFIALNYSGSPEGKEAEALLKTSIPVLAEKEFTTNDSEKRFNVIYTFENTTSESIESFMKILALEVEKIKFYTLTVSKDVYDTNTTFVVVHGLRSYNGAQGFAELLNSENKDDKGQNIPSKITKSYIPISSANYAIIQRHKNLEDYKNL